MVVYKLTTFEALRPLHTPERELIRTFTQAKCQTRISGLASCHTMHEVCVAAILIIGLFSTAALLGCKFRKRGSASMRNASLRGSHKEYGRDNHGQDDSV